MSHRKLLVWALFTSALVLILHTQALKHFYYWQYDWYDLVVHFFAGMSVSLLVMAIAIGLNPERRFSLQRTMSIALVTVLIFAVAWEIFELVEHMVFTTRSYALDTTLDILMGLIGGYAGAYLSYKANNKDVRE